MDLRCVGMSTFKDVTCIEIIEEYGIIAVSGACGCCHLWQYDFIGKEEATLTCLCRLGEINLSTNAVSGLSRLMGTRRGDDEVEANRLAEEEKKKAEASKNGTSVRKQRTTRPTIRYEAQIKQTAEEADAAESVDGYVRAARTPIERASH